MSETRTRRARDSRLRSPARFSRAHALFAQNVPIANVKKLGELKGVTVEVGEGLPHDYLNMNKDGDLTSSETIEYLVGYAETRLSNLP